MASVKNLILNFIKLDNFMSVRFRRWQKKILILLTSLNIAYVNVISTPKSEEKENETLKELGGGTSRKTMTSYAEDIYFMV